MPPRVDGNAAPRVMRGLGVGAIAAALVAAPLGAQDASWRTRGVEVRVEVGDLGQVQVRERLQLAGPLPDSRFEWLRGACAEVRDVRFGIAGAALTTEVTEHAPWHRVSVSDLRDAPAEFDLEIGYAVRLTARDAGIPLVMPDAVLRADSGVTGPLVHLEVSFQPAAGAGRSRVALPRLQPDAVGRVWTGSAPALPSAVRVRVADDSLPRACATEADRSEGARRLRGIVAAFVVTLVAWVIVYMAWVAREPASARPTGIPE